jgi:hypothetical protein
LRGVRFRFAFAVAALALVACGSDALPAADAGSTTACTPGQEASCLCSDGVGYAGVLTCASDGAGYGACAGCPAPTDAGPDGDDASDDASGATLDAPLEANDADDATD